MADPDAFSACLDIVLRQEGGYADNPADPGGATKFGITRATLANWREISPWWRLPKSEVAGLAREEAAAIYRAFYWDRCRAGDLPAGLDLSLFDFAVNSGPDRAIKALQSEIGTRADGIIGPLTLDAIRARIAVAGIAGLIVALCDGRLNFLQRLAISATFGAGWARRVDEIRALALARAGVSSQPQKGPEPMNLSILAGYKTYIVGAAMLIAGLAELLGVSIPSFAGQAAGDLLMQGLAVIFLRQGINNAVKG
jgi:lysozyme family protein